MHNFFHRLGNFVGHGLCYTAAATAMLALKGNRTARLVEISYTDDELTDNTETQRHRWVEFRRGGIWWVLDLAWLPMGLNLRGKYRSELKAKLDNFQVVRTCSYEQFWSYPISQTFYEKMQQPKSSWLMNEILGAYSRYSDETHDEMFHPDIQELTMLEIAGSRSSLSWALNNDFNGDLLVTPRIMRELMGRTERLRPKARTVRRAQSMRRKLRYAYIQLLAAHGEIEFAQETAAQYGMNYETALRCKVPEAYQLCYTTKPSS